MHDVVEISVKDYYGTEFILLARDMDEALLLKQEIEDDGNVVVNNVLVMKDGEVAGYIEDALIMLAFLDDETTHLRECKDDQPKFALLD